MRSTIPALLLALPDGAEHVPVVHALRELDARPRGRRGGARAGEARHPIEIITGEIYQK